MVQWFKKLIFLRRNRAPIQSRLDAVLRPLHYEKCMGDRRYVGLLIDRSHPVFLQETDLASADVLFCAVADDNLVHGLISYGASGEYVHVAVYTGAGRVVEAVQEGVVESSLDEVIDRYPYVAVCRCPGTGSSGIPGLADKVVEFCQRHVKTKTPYNGIGALKSPALELRELRYQRKHYICSDHVPRSKPKDAFFCSELVIEAFIYGGYIPEGQMHPAGYSPSALSEDAIFNLQGFLGCPEMAEHILRHDPYLSGGISCR